LNLYATEFLGSMAWGKRNYQKSFVATKTKFINWEVVLDHPIAREGLERFFITATLYDPKGREVEKSQTLAWVEKNMHWSQWGRTFALTTWTPGTYQVAIAVDDKEYVRRSFLIEDVGVGADFLPALNAKVASIRFFEREKDLPPIYKREYGNRFPRAAARFINWELWLEFPPSPQKVEFSVVSYWYGPDDKLLDTISTRHTIHSGWLSSIITAGRGSITPGAWRPGAHKVVLKINEKEVASATFQVVE
jgi:hypothetical protein